MDAAWEVVEHKRTLKADRREQRMVEAANHHAKNEKDLEKSLEEEKEKKPVLRQICNCCLLPGSHFLDKCTPINRRMEAAQKRQDRRLATCKLEKEESKKEDHVDDASTVASESWTPSRGEAVVQRPALLVPARDGVFYSHAEFLAHYGPVRGELMWEEASMLWQRIPSDTKSQTRPAAKDVESESMAKPRGPHLFFNKREAGQLKKLKVELQELDWIQKQIDAGKKMELELWQWRKVIGKQAEHRRQELQKSELLKMELAGYKCRDRYW